MSDRLLELDVQAVRLLLKRTYSIDRMNALSDGVYAFALTLLVLDLKASEIPGVTNPELSADLPQ